MPGEGKHLEAMNGDVAELKKALATGSLKEAHASAGQFSLQGSLWLFVKTRFQCLL